MLSKPIGSTGFFSLSSTTGTFTATTFAFIQGDLGGNGPGQNLPATKVRIAVSGLPAVVNFGNNKVADNNSDILIPPGTVEHFTLQNTNTITYVLPTGVSGSGLISITPVA